MKNTNIKSFLTGVLFTLITLTLIGMKSYYDIDDVISKLDDFESSISIIDSKVTNIEDSIGGEYDYGTVLYKLREIDNGVECDGGYIDEVYNSVDCN